MTLSALRRRLSAWLEPGTGTVVRTRCPNCLATIILRPRVGGDDYHPDRGGKQTSYKKGSATCRHCGCRVSPILSVRTRL